MRGLKRPIEIQELKQETKYSRLEKEELLI